MAEMTDAERDDFLAERRVAVLAIERVDKGPLCAPVWYRRDENGRFQVAMADDSAKARLLRATGCATLCVQQDSRPYQYVTVEGPVELHVLSAAERVEALSLIAARYLGVDGAKAYVENFPDHDEALVTLTPRRWRTEVLL